jgi:hypothetical protein
MSDRFEFDAAGTLRHFIDDELRAVVAADQIASYQESQPDAPSPPADPTTTTTEENHHDEETQSPPDAAAPPVGAEEGPV